MSNFLNVFNIVEEFLFNVDWQLNAMRYLILLRHGESADKQHGQHDFDRVLTERGIESIKQVAVHLSHEKLLPDYALVSPANRTKQTAQLVLECLSLKVEPQFEAALYHGDDWMYKNLIENTQSEWKCFLLVGHNPSISALVGRLTQRPFSGLHPGQVAILGVEKEIMKAELVRTF